MSERYVMESESVYGNNEIRQRINGYEIGYCSKQKIPGMNDWAVVNPKRYTNKIPNGECILANVLTDYDSNIPIGELCIELFINHNKYTAMYRCYKPINNNKV